MSEPVVAIVEPCYNEEEVLPETIRRLQALRGELVEEKMISPKSALLFVDDGSHDDTWKVP